MPKLEFGDFYKFIVSIGIILIAISLVLPWLLVQESYEPVLSDEEFTGLESQTQELLIQRNSIALWILDHIIFIVTAFLCLGVFLFYLGARFWFDRQKIRDENEDLDHLKKVENLRNASITQKIDEITEEIYDEEPKESEVINQAFENIRTHISTEKEILDLLIKNFSKSHTVFTEKQIQNHVLDAILVTRSLQHPDIIVEIKRVSKIEEPIIEKYVRQVSDYVKLYGNEFKRSAAGLLILVLSNNYELTDYKIKQFKWMFYEDYHEIQNKIFMEFIRENNIPFFDYEDLIGDIGVKFSDYKF